MLLAALGLVFSCQRVELPEEDVVTSPEEGVFGKATISFSAMLPSIPQTKAMGDDPLGSSNNDIKSMHLVIFDANGMLVETCEAELAKTSETHGNVSTGKQDKDGNDITTDHLYETEFTVTVTMTDQPRTIHFIANCPVDQVIYGHETSVIGNMYVGKDEDPGTPETAYWARVKVSDLIIEDAETDNPHFKNEDVANAFRCVPMLRNFAQITVIDTESEKITVPEGHTFEYLGFTLYNTVDLGTVAPYNSKSGEFQSFINPLTGLKYKYPALMELTDEDGKSIAYEGHALAASKLNQSLEMDSTSDDGYKWYPSGTSFYMYERKISVKTDEEEMWNESPPHRIIKGKFDGKLCYYKADLVYKIIENGKDEAREIKYYNILRNFKYQFTITKVDSKGYDSVEAAIRGATSNNLAGSSTTSKFTNISDNVGRLWVSYTSKTLVTGDDITLYYRYEPVLGSGNFNNNTIEQGGVVFFEDAEGKEVMIEGSNVIRQFTVAATDETSGEWVGYRRVDIKVNNPQAMAKEQTVVLRTDKATLSRQIQYTLRNKYNMVLDCTPAVLAKIGEEVKLDIKLPGGLTANMFPLALKIEVADMTLSPNADKNTIPVEVGTSTVPGKEGKPAFFYVWTLETKEDYDRLPSDGTNKVIETYWYTNIAKSASTIYVTNSYFNPADDSFLNGVIFTNVYVKANSANTELEELFYGEGEKVGITFTMSADDANYQNKEVTVKLNGLADANGNTEFTRTVNNLTVTINDLVTTSLDGNVSFTVSHPEYISVTSDEVTRYPGTFSELKVGDGRDVLKGDDVKTSVSFTMDATDQNYTNRTVVVRFNGLIDENGKQEREISLAGYTNRTVTINNLYTLSANGNISFTVSEKGATYTPATSKVYYRRDRAFTNVGITQNNVSAAAGENVTFNFTIEEEEFTEGMVINVNMEGLVAASTGSQGQKDVLVPVTTKAANNSYTYTPSKAGNKTLNLKTTETVAGNCTVTISADGFAAAVDEVEQELKSFQSLTLPNRVASGTNKSVNITFKLADGDNNKDVTVTFENMSRNGETTLTFNTGDRNYVTNNNGTYTITNVVTTGANNATLKVTISAAGYESKSATCSTRRNGTFTTMTLNKDELGGKSGEEATLTFSVSDYEPGMTVTVDLDGLIPADNNLQTKAGSYIYTVTSAANQTVKLKTEKVDGNPCSITLSSEGFESKSLSVERYITIPKAKLIAQGSTKDMFLNGGKIYIYSDSNYSNELANYSYTRGKNGSVNNAKATNSDDIKLYGVSVGNKLYIRHTNGNSKYSGSFTLSDSLINGTSTTVTVSK